MHLSNQLRQHQSENNPIRVVLIGAGKFGCMYLSQARQTPGVHVAAIVDIDVSKVRAALPGIGWEPERFAAASLDDALSNGSTLVTDNPDVMRAPQIDVVIEATGHVNAGVYHAQTAIDSGKHVVMVTVEADVVVGSILAQKAKSNGVVYSLAYGDQPALICEMVDWARSCGFKVTCAGKGTKYLPKYHGSTPETVWDYYGFNEQQVAGGDYNPRMFNSFLDGTKSAIEMAAVANAASLMPPESGLLFPPCPSHQLSSICIPKDAGGVLAESGTVEVVSSLYRDGSEVANDLRWGVYVTFESENPYVQRCFSEYGAVTDPSGRYAALFRPTHFIGLELGYSVVKAALSAEATGSPQGFVADVVAVAKTDLNQGTRLDGEGGYTVYGKLTTAQSSVREDSLPLGMANDLTLARDITAGAVVRWSDVSPMAPNEVQILRRQLVGK